jgi:hypothetical protein
MDRWNEVELEYLRGEIARAEAQVAELLAK